MPSSRLFATDPAPTPDVINWGGTPAVMVRRYSPPRRPPARPPDRRPAQRPAPPPAQLPALEHGRLRDLDPLPDDSFWLADELFAFEPKPERADSIRRLLSSAVTVLVVLNFGALLMRAHRSNGNRPALTALQALSPSSVLPPTSTTALATTSTSNPATSTTIRKVLASTKAKSGATGIPNTVTASGTWGCIIQHESGGNPRAVNRYSGAGGLFQFLPSSWIMYGGSGLPQNATVQEQWRIALNAYARSGFTPWRGDGCV